MYLYKYERNLISKLNLPQLTTKPHYELVPFSNFMLSEKIGQK